MGFFSELDEFLFGPPGEVSGVIGSVVDVALENPGKAALLIGATVATGGTALVCAPTIGAMASAAGLGVAGGTLSGAAASSAGLAVLGGGSLASGGLGMAGGTAVVTIVGGSAGAAVSGTAVKVASELES